MDTQRYSGPKLKTVLDTQGRRYDWLAKQIEMDPSYLSKVLRGDLPLSFRYALRAANVLGIPVHWLATDPDEPPTPRGEGSGDVTANSL